MVPENWSIKKLEDLAIVERGKFSARPRNDPRYYGGKIPFVQTGDVAAAKTFLTNFSQTLNEAGLAVSRLFPSNIILITIAANIGDTAITTFNVACPDSLVAISPKDNVDCFWLYSYLQTCKDELDGKATQNAQKNINLQVLKPLEVLVPSVAEQRKIAKILSTWDKAIATTEKLIATSKQQKKALMQQLLTGKKRLLNPETGWVFEGDWEEVPLESHIDLLSGNAFKSSEFQKNANIKLLRGINISRGYLRWGEEQTYSWTDISGYEKYLLGLNDIVISMDGSLVGRNYALITENNFEEMLLVQRVARLRCKKTLHSDYLFQHIASKQFESYVDAVKTVTAIPHISAKDIRNFKIPVPELQEQQKIAQVLTTADQEIERLESKLAHFQQEKKALMQQLLTGKRRVKIDDVEAA